MESVNDMRIKNGLMLLLTAFIWGTAFVAQSVGMDYLEPFTFNGVRSLIEERHFCHVSGSCRN